MYKFVNYLRLSYPLDTPHVVIETAKATIMESVEPMVGKVINSIELIKDPNRN